MSADQLRGKYYREVISRGKNYVNNVKYCIILKNNLYSEVYGASLYRTKFDLKTFEGTCSCPYGNNCKHAVATYLYYKKGKSINADTYINDLKKLSKKGLIKLIEKLLPANPNLIIAKKFREETNFDKWVDDFIENISVDSIEDIAENVDCLNFEHLIKLLDYISENEDELFDSIMDNDYYGDCHDEDDILGDFEYELKEELVKRIKTEEQLKIVLKKKYCNELICEQGESFFKYKAVMKKNLERDEYFVFLLHCKNPDLSEIKEYLNEENKYYLYKLCSNNVNLAKKVADFLNDKNLKFLIAYEEEDVSNIIRYFSCFKDIAPKYFIRPDKLVKSLIKSKAIIPKEIIIAVFTKENIKNYFSKEQINYLLKNIDDINFVLDNIPYNADFSKLKIIIEHLAKLKYDTKLIFYKKDLLIGKHWTKIIDILRYIKGFLGEDFLNEFIKSHKKQFITSSTLKFNLKKEGVFIRNIKGKLEVEIK